MQLGIARQSFNKFTLGLIAMISITLVACGGGGGGGTSSNNPPTPAEVAAITPAQIATYSSTQIIALGTNIQYLSNAALGALKSAVQATANQIGAIADTQIAVLSPAQVRYIGSPSGSLGTGKVASLNATAWLKLVSDPLQVAAITAAEAATLSVTEIPAIGTNIQYLSNDALGAFIAGVTFNQVYAITAAQITVLSPVQVRFIGSTGAATSKIYGLNAGAWAQLVSDPLQVAAITAAEAATLSVTEIPAIGTNIQYLSNAALGAFISGITFNQIDSILATQIAVLSPAQVRFIGSTVGGVTSTSKIAGLNAGAWAQLVGDPLQVAAITAAEIPTLMSNSFTTSKIIAFGTNVQYLSIAATTALTAMEKAALTAAQLAAMSPAQHTACGC